MRVWEYGAKATTGEAQLTLSVACSRNFPDIDLLSAFFPN
jgi:hypothetical protein